MKKIGKIVLIAFVALILLSALSSACSRSSSKTSSSSGVPAASSSEKSSSVTVTKADFVGTWDMTKFKSKDQSFNTAQLQKARSQGSDSYLVLNDDGSALIVAGDTVSDCAWELSADSSVKLSFGQSSMSGILENDTLSFKENDDEMAFTRGEARKSLPNENSAKSASSDDSAATSESTSDSEVSADLKEMLDSYEAFVDEYVQFMKEYKESGDATSMLASYSEYMQKYSDFMQKVNSVDTSNLSASDYAYYIEVTSRVSQKLLKTM